MLLIFSSKGIAKFFWKFIFTLNILLFMYKINEAVLTKEEAELFLGYINNDILFHSLYLNFVVKLIKFDLMSSITNTKYSRLIN